MDPRYAVHLAGRGHDQEGAAGLALVVCVDAVVGLLVPNEFEGFVFAGWQGGTLEGNGIYAFGGREVGMGGLDWV